MKKPFLKMTYKYDQLSKSKKEKIFVTSIKGLIPQIYMKSLKPL